MDYLKELVQEIKNSNTDEEIESILLKLCKPIIDMKNILQNDILPNDEVLEPYDIDLNFNGFSIYKTWYDFDIEETDSKIIYQISDIDFFKSMFNIPVSRT